MKIALISDIHANSEALDAVLASIERQSVDRIVCLGDLVGYHADPNECIERVADSCATVIAGNHDLAAIDRMDPSDFGETARRSTRWTRGTLTSKSRRYLEQLPITHRLDEHVLLFHGALHPVPNTELHLSTRRRVAHSMRALERESHGASIGCFGHTHRPAVYERRTGRLTERLGRRGEARIELLPGASYLINPGSVGQSRDRDSRAAYALLDTRTRLLELRRVAYDRAGCLAKASRAGLLPQSATRTPRTGSRQHLASLARQ